MDSAATQATSALLEAEVARNSNPAASSATKGEITETLVNHPVNFFSRERAEMGKTAVSHTKFKKVVDLVALQTASALAAAAMQGAILLEEEARPIRSEDLEDNLSEWMLLFTTHS